jgi:ankyrin repeat protein
MLASQNGHTEALKLLVANGAKVNAANEVIQN